jgi:hypothetical protein
MLVDHALPRLRGIRRSCRAAFARYLGAWRRDTNYSAWFAPFFHQNAGLPVTVCYSIIDGRLTRTTPERFGLRFVIGGAGSPAISSRRTKPSPSRRTDGFCHAPRTRSGTPSP